MNNDDDDLAAAVAALKNIPLRCRLFFISFVCMKSEDKMKSQAREREGEGGSVVLLLNIPSTGTFFLSSSDGHFAIIIIHLLHGMENNNLGRLYHL